ncbi:3-isopropylmalate dehydrogenase [Ruminococcus flavefaciens]|uniref:3-isopropylmalate dehydrogenase n=2 Tax=Ruminococcus flavefaciens TaxID=1265 RepID=A0A315Y0F0_RUMFL|nr:3-isopropylmalate dehydrogenase [Ruminococcus flavefaciens]PWJ13404.1 3-isopropylmalate dehydrogenase [Ruminococcus flavefaciens]SSA47917.1 3-isopropylmalate dehydrogenase [Ruminococcus flavefaciens]
MELKIALLKGDGIGPEIVDSAVAVLEKTAEKFGHKFTFTPYLIGGCAIDETGIPLPQETVDGCLASDSVILGAVGGPKWDDQPGDKRPEKALLGIRSAMGLFTNLRPAKLYPALRGASPLKDEIVGDGFDIMIVRELTGGIYFGDRGYREGKYGQEAFDTEAYSVTEIERIGKVAFEAAMKRSKRLCSVDKANVLESSRLWRRTMHELSEQYPEVEYKDMFVDNAAMQLVRDPKQFDVIVTSNMFGDILSDEASQITGSIGMLASASLGASKRGLYEPIHGSAPDIAGKNMANPIATILSGAMMLRYSFGLIKEAETIENAVDKVLDAGLRTADLMGSDKDQPLSCTEMTEAILKVI